MKSRGLGDVYKRQGLIILIGTFCLVFGMDKNRPAKTRKYLLYTALICVFLVWGLITAIMLQPLG